MSENYKTFSSGFKEKNQNQKNFQFWVLEKLQTSVGFHEGTGN